jgi:hypothetical protein
MNDRWDFPSPVGKPVDTLEKSLIEGIADSERTIPDLPYSSAKLGFVNNPG